MHAYDVCIHGQYNTTHFHCILEWDSLTTIRTLTDVMGLGATQISNGKVVEVVEERLQGLLTDNTHT